MTLQENMSLTPLKSRHCELNFHLNGTVSFNLERNLVTIQEFSPAWIKQIDHASTCAPFSFISCILLRIIHEDFMLQLESGIAPFISIMNS